MGDLFNLEPKRAPAILVEFPDMTFSDDEKRREYFLEKLAKLHGTEFRKIEGFPVGLDEDFLVLSNLAVLCRLP